MARELTHKMFQVGYFQFSPAFGCIRENLNTVLENLENTEADLIVLPELPFTGYSFKDRQELLEMAEPPDDSVIVEALAGMCCRKGMHIVTGFAERNGNKLFNSALLIGPDGLEGTYRKLHLFNREKLCFDPGDLPLSVHHVHGVGVGMMVCFDWIFPEVARTLAILGADILCHPANLVLDHCQRAMTVRCTENMIFSVTANRTGSESRSGERLEFTGRSQIVAPGGELLHGSDRDSREVFVTGINPARSRNKFITQLNDVIKDRRPEYYGLDLRQS